MSLAYCSRKDNILLCIILVHACMLYLFENNLMQSDRYETVSISTVITM